MRYKPISAFFLAVLLAGCETASSQRSMAPPEHAWQMVWSDEFNGAHLDETKWSYEVDCWGGGNKEKQCYTDRPQNLTVEDGHLKITARKELSRGYAHPAEKRAVLSNKEREAQAEQPFSSAKILTRGKADWRYGRIEARAAFPSGQGLWSAIWMMPAESVYGGWAASGEIDIVEAINLGAQCDTCADNEEDRVIGALHFGGPWPKNTHKAEKTALPPSDDGFNIFAVEWQEEKISWLLNGKPYATLTSDSWYTDNTLASDRASAPFDQKFFLIINLAVGGRLPEESNEGGVDHEGFPKTLIVDWVRVYQQSNNR